MKIDLTKNKEDIFYKYVYPLTAKKFLFGCLKYEDFANYVYSMFILSPEQWAEVLKCWEEKETILKD